MPGAGRRRSRTGAAASLLALATIATAPVAQAFSTPQILRLPATDDHRRIHHAAAASSSSARGSGSSTSSTSTSRRGVVLMGALPPFDAPYSQPEEEKNFWGTDYVPKLDHPGSMPPGTRLEDKPIEELSPVSRIPYPHFQEWPWHYRFPAYQPRRLDFVEWMTQRGLMVEDDGDTRGVRFLGRKRRFRAQKAQADRAAAGTADPMTPDEKRMAFEGIDGDYWRSEGAELVDPEQFIFEQAKTQRSRIPYIVKIREDRAAKAAAAEAAAAAAGGLAGGLMGEEAVGGGGGLAGADGGLLPAAPEAAPPAKGKGKGRSKKANPPTAEI